MGALCFGCTWSIAPAALGASAPDVVVAGQGTAGGYHLFTATAEENWAWRPLATIQPGGDSSDEWIGYQCLTGSGRYVVAVVAPRYFANRPILRDRGAFAYSVDVRSGRVRPLARGVALKYHTPGCGLSDRVTLTRHLGRDQARTEILLSDARRARILRTMRTRGQVTSAVPVGDEVVGAIGGTIVRVGRRGYRKLAEAGGQAYMFRPTRTGVDMLVVRSSSRAEVRNLRRGRVSSIGSGGLRELALFQGVGGRNVVVGASKLSTRRLRRARMAAGAVRGASLRGGVVLSEPPRGRRAWAAATRQAGADDTSPVLPRLTGARTGRVVNGALPAPLTHAYTRLPGSPGVSARASANTTTPKCAVPRNHLRRQVPQPNADQVRWAIEQATRNFLQGGVLTRPSNYANMGLASYQPSLDFTRGTLAGSSSSVPVPPSVIEAVFAQESAWKQATFRALPGVSGNPLVADYYGAGGTLDRIDYDQADCGYGLSQITDPMTAASTRYSANGKSKVAVDYAENTAAGITFLVEKWNQLYNAGVTVNNADPSVLENWYFAVWAYNSGFHPDPGGGQPWGVGWTNNPMNADYPPNREPFLRTTYADAEHPADWPYQERVFGWMETPMLDYKGNPSYPTPINAATPSAASGVQVPAYTTFCTTSNDCSPTYQNPAGPDLNYCMRSDRKCWWHEPVTFADCPSDCAASRYTYDGSATEPPGDNNYPPQCTSSLGSDAIIVDDQPDNLNVEGCGAANWDSEGTFSVAHGENSAGTPLGVIDWHQLGTGFGGHTWFTKTRSSGDTAHINTGTWTPPDIAGVYNIKAHIPANGASTGFATYTIHRGDGTTHPHTINQHLHENRWVSLGNYTLQAGAKVVLTNVTGDTPGTKNVAFDALAFTPISGARVVREVDALTVFDENQDINTNLHNWQEDVTFSSDTHFNSMTDIYTWARDLSTAVTSKPACLLGLQSQNCVSPGTRNAFIRWRNRVLAAGDARQEPQASDTQPKWLAFANPDPADTLNASALDPDNFKVRSRLTVEYFQDNGVIDADSVTVTLEEETGNTHLPTFIKEIFQAYQADYGIAKPDLRYSAVDLGQYSHDITAVNINANGGIAPGRSYKPYSTPPSVSSSCVSVRAVSGGTIGFKPMLHQTALREAVNAWHDRVRAVVAQNKAPQALATAADEIRKEFFSDGDLGPFGSPAVADLTSPFWFAPPIWIQHNLKVCGGGTVSSNNVNLVDSSYMPDLYIYLDGEKVNQAGAQTSSPVQTGDFRSFSNPPSPWRLNGDEDPWKPCVTNRSDVDYVSDRDGSPWELEFSTGEDESPTSLRLCTDESPDFGVHTDP